MAYTSSFLTIRQTAEAFMPKSHLVFYTIEEKPVAPTWVQERLAQSQEPIGARGTNGSIYIWNVDGNVYVQHESGASLYFEVVPSLAHPVHKSNKGDFCQIHDDGAVTCRIDDKTYYYSAPFEGTPVETNHLLRKRWSAEKETWLFEGVDLTTEELDTEERTDTPDHDANTGSDYDSDDGGPRCCRECWKNALTPEQREALELRCQLGFYERILEQYKGPAAEGDEKAQASLAWYTECQQRALERAAAFEARTGIALTTKATEAS